MFTLNSDRVAARGAAVLVAGLLLGVVPAAVTSVADAAALPAAKLTATLSAGDSTSGSSTVFNDPAAIPTFGVTIAPDKAGQKATLKIGRLVTGTFQPLFSQAFDVRADSTVEVPLRDWHAGGTYRAQWSYAGDKVNRASTSNVNNFKFAGKQTDIVTPKVKFTAPTKARKNKKFAVSVTVTRSEGRFLQRANLYSDKYNVKKKKWVSFSNGTIVLKAKNAAATVASAKTTFVGSAGKYRLRAAYLGDAGNGRASSPWITVVVK